MRFIHRFLGVLTGMALALTVLAAPAHAADDNQSGLRTEGCNVEWYAQSDHTETRPNPSTTGFLYGVWPTEPHLHPGVLEIQHWLGGTTLFWRLPVGTENPIDSARITLTLPAGYTWAGGPGGYNTWRDTYPNLVTLPPEAVQINDNTVTIDLADMPAMSSTVVQFTATIPPDEVNNSFVAEATMTGLYRDGQGCTVVPPKPDPIPPKVGDYKDTETYECGMKRVRQRAVKTFYGWRLVDNTWERYVKRRTTVFRYRKPTRQERRRCEWVIHTFQVDRYTWPNRKMAEDLAGYDDDGVLSYREDRAFWGRSDHEFVKVRVRREDNAQALLRVLNRESSFRIDTRRKIGRLAGRAGSAVVAWELGRKATPKHPWGRGKRVDQTFFGRSS